MCKVVMKVYSGIPCLECRTGEIFTVQSIHALAVRGVPLKDTVACMKAKAKRIDEHFRREELQ